MSADRRPGLDQEVQRPGLTIGDRMLRGRQRFVETTSAVALALMLSACTPFWAEQRTPPAVAAIASPSPVPTSIPLDENSKYDLKREGTYSVDQGLETIKHPFLEAVSFSFQASQESNIRPGRFLVELGLKDEGEVRLITEESTPGHSGFIYNHSWELVKSGGGVLIAQRNDRQLVPAIRVAEGETYTVRVGYQRTDAPYADSYKDTRTYSLRRDANDASLVDAHAEGQTSIDPEDSENFKPRDKEAAQPLYWQKENLK